jgi:hypothetical protein
MQSNNTGPSDLPVSPKDGRIDFSKYSTEQLQDLRHTIDGRSHPQNLRNLLAELSKREAAGPDAVIFRDLHELAVRFTPRNGIVGWAQGVLSRSTLYGSGEIEQARAASGQRSFACVVAEPFRQVASQPPCSIHVEVRER